MRTHVFASLILAASSATADAHFTLTYPHARYSNSSEGMWYGVCGRDPETGRDHVTILHSGSTITLTLIQTIFHPGYFRVSFDSDGEDDFPPHPAAYGMVEDSPAILMNNIPAVTASLSVDITLPNIECDNCTLQVLNVLADKPPFGTFDDFHHQCADLVLVNDTVFAGNFEI